MVLILLISPHELSSQAERPEGEPCKFTVRVDTGIVYHSGSDPEIKGTVLKFCPGSNLTLTLTYSGANCSCNAPQWKKNGLSISGATAYIITVSDTGSYSVDMSCSPYGFATLNQGPIAFATCLATDIRNNSPVSERMLFYPNPVTDILEIQGSEIENAEYIVITAIGETVLSGNLSNRQRVDFSNLPDGIYFFALRNNSDIFKQKVIKTASR